jgi:hypothetical protein
MQRAAKDSAFRFPRKGRTKPKTGIKNQKSKIENS